MKIKLQHKQTKKIKYITKLDTYPIAVGENIAFSNSTTVDDVWVVVAIKMEEETKAGAITPQQRQQLKKGLAERTKERRRKEEERRQHIYK